MQKWIAFSLALLALSFSSPASAQTRNLIEMGIQVPSGEIGKLKVWEGEPASISFREQRSAAFYLWPTVTDAANGVVTLTITDSQERDTGVLEVIALTAGNDFAQTQTDPRFGVRVLRISQQ